MKQPCKYCLQPIDPRGMLSHLHFKHARCIRHEFAMNPLVQLMRLMWDGEMPHFAQKQLPAPNPLTVYSTQPLGVMAAPLPWLRRPKGYTPPQGYAQPWQTVHYTWRYWV